MPFTPEEKVMRVRSAANILIVGVGGQGTILASRAIARAVLDRGLDVKVSEIHGMAQRGGSVVTQVRWGEKIYAPTIEPGTADVILAFEKMEALRWLHYLRPGGSVIVNTQEIYPLPVLTGKAQYPENAVEVIREKAVDVTAVDALNVAKQCGSAKAVNVVLLGVLAVKVEADLEHWRQIIKTTVPEKTIPVNIAAFDAGAAAATSS